MDDLINLEIIPPGSKMTVDISTDLYIQLQQVLLEGIPYRDLDHFKAILQEVRSGKPKDQLTYYANALIHLLNLIEDAAKEQKLIKTERFDTKTQKTVKD